MMTELRWILLIIGVIIVIAVYAYSRYQSHAKDEKEFSRPSPAADPLANGKQPKENDIPSLRVKPSPIKIKDVALQNMPTIDKPEDLQAHLLPQGSSDDSPATLIVLHVWARAEQNWPGKQLMAAAAKAGLKATDKNIFQYFHQNNNAAPLFHVANKSKPGTFAWDKMEQFETQGLSLFMKLPVFCPAKEAFLLMHACAQRLANLLDGEILDKSYKPLEKKTVDEIHRLCSAMDKES